MLSIVVVLPTVPGFIRNFRCGLNHVIAIPTSIFKMKLLFFFKEKSVFLATVITTAGKHFLLNYKMQHKIGSSYHS